MTKERMYPFLHRAYSDAYYKRSEHIRVRLPMSGRRTLIDDVETGTDFTQRRLFGNGALMTDHWDGNTLTCETLKRVAYYAEDLPDIRPLTFKILKDVCDERGINVIPHEAYVRHYLLHLGQRKLPHHENERGTIAGYNISFDMFRHGREVTYPRGPLFGDGLGCTLLDEPWAPYYRESRMGIGMRRELTRRKTDHDTWFPPVVVDLAQMVRAMSGKPHNLLSAGRVFGCQVLKFDKPETHDPEVNYKGDDLEQQIRHYIEYALQDVDATAELYEKVMTRFYRHPVRLRPEEYVSAASLDKAYMRAMGIHAAFCTCSDCKPRCTCKTECPICPDCAEARRCSCDICKSYCTCGIHHHKRQARGAWKVPKKTMGLFTAAFLGARSECGSRLMNEPGTLWDWKSMYPAVMTLGGDWKFRIAERIEVRNVTAEMQAFLDRVTLADLRKPETWEYMRGIAEHRGDCLIPERIGIGSVSSIATKHVPPLADDEPNLVSTIRDLVASKLRTGETPKIIRALKPFPIGRQSTLQPIKFAGRIEFDPAKDNWYQFLVNQRQALKNAGDPFDEESAYKETVNADYGISAEMNISDREATIYGLNGQSWKSSKAETPGEYTNLLLAPDITAGARLMLAMFQTQINEAGTHHILMDTDSIAPMATPDGSEGISWDQVREIAEQFDSLNPWDRRMIPHLIDWQYPAKNSDGTREPLRISSVAAKRYALWRMNDDSIEIVKRSEHGLGGYLSPYAHAAQLADDSDDAKRLRKRFIDEIWAYGIAKYVLGLDPDDPWWFGLPAVQQFKIRTRFAYRQFNYPDKPYLEKVIPQNFFLTVSRPMIAKLQDWESADVRLVAPFTPDQSQWLGMEWTDIETGQPYHITTDETDKAHGLILVKTYRDLIHEYFTHPESKYVDAKGNACRPYTRGILYPGTATPEYHSHISKDASAVRTALDHFSYQGGHVFHSDEKDRMIPLARFILRAKKVSVRDVEHGTGVARENAYRFLTTATTLRKSHLESIIDFASDIAMEDMRAIKHRMRIAPSQLEILREWKALADSGALDIPKYQRPTQSLCDVLPPGFTLTAEDITPGGNP